MCVSEWMWMCICHEVHWRPEDDLRHWSCLPPWLKPSLYHQLFYIHQASWPVSFWGFCLRLPPQRRSTDVSDMWTTLSGFMWVQRLTLPPQALYPFRHHSRPWVEDYEWRPTSHLLSYYLKGRGRRIITSLRTAWATKWYPDSKTTTKQSSNDKTKPKLGEKVIWYPCG